ncbi:MULTISPECIES: hypothetical protein [unclassified Aeromicrobium]|uniref:hypothetical protein n=1 Tax=unclassified Aeromicrobium TaxID=2633570 RepID=UPI00288C5F0F|nr:MULTISPECIES: hypothetical protein [unclassified Aeromicrobium]
MKQPITTEDIRPGDLIRWESTTIDGLAREYRATGNEKQKPGESGNLFRIGHPVADSLPSELTLGRLEWQLDGRPFAEVAEWVVFRQQMIGGSTGIPIAAVTRFTPVVAVDKALIESLVNSHREAGHYIPAHDRNLSPGRLYFDVVDHFLKTLAATDAHYAAKNPR